MPGSKPEDTQALSKKDINEAGINYRPRTRTNQQAANTPAVLVSGIITLGVVAVAFLAAFVLVVLTIMGRL